MQNDHPFKYVPPLYECSLATTYNFISQRSDSVSQEFREDLEIYIQQTNEYILFYCVGPLDLGNQSNNPIIEPPEVQGAHVEI
jgi:hypothetical protein